MIEYYDKEELELQISNYLSGNSTDEEKETLLAFLASNEAAARTFREMSAVWALSSVPSFAEIENSNLVRIKERMTAPASSKPVRKLIPVWLKVAAAVILLIGCNLFPNEQALYNKNTGRMEKLKTNASKACDWLDGGLTFENASFADIAHRLERKFQVKISIESERLKAEHFSGSFDSNQNIYDILHEINVEKQYTWKVSGDTIFITDKRKGVR